MGALLLLVRLGCCNGPAERCKAFALKESWLVRLHKLYQENKHQGQARKIEGTRLATTWAVVSRTDAADLVTQLCLFLARVQEEDEQ
jgi:hypothetical protein